MVEKRSTNESLGLGCEAATCKMLERSHRGADAL